MVPGRLGLHFLLVPLHVVEVNLRGQGIVQVHHLNMEGGNAAESIMKQTYATLIIVLVIIMYFTSYLVLLT
jgi:hypothetical protein